MNYDSMMRARENGGVYTSHIEGCEIFKDPITDDGTKKSAKGLLYVGRKYDGTLKMVDCVSQIDEKHGLLKIGISKLSEPVHHFKNLVHLEKEKISKHTISEPIAKEAVTSIFTISIDF